MTTTLDDLIARLEKAEGPDRELDADIAEFLDPDIEKFGMRLPTYRITDAGIEDLKKWRRDFCPSFTASIDAAETTALKGWRWSVGNGPNGYEAHCFRTFPPGERDGSYGRGDSFSRLDAPTPAIALTTVFLKARKTEAAA